MIKLSEVTVYLVTLLEIVALSYTRCCFSEQRTTQECIYLLSKLNKFFNFGYNIRKTNYIIDSCKVLQKDSRIQKTLIMGQ